MAGHVDYRNATPHSLSQAFLHPRFSPTTMRFDLALLELHSALPNSISAACLPTQRPKRGEHCQTGGWGDLTGAPHSSLLYALFGIPQRSHKLQTLRVDISSRLACSLLLQRRIPDDMLCAGNARRVQLVGRGTCYGDSGGPLTCRRRNGRVELVGLVSWGTKCGRRYRPEVYANVYGMLEALESKVEGLDESAVSA